MSKYAASMDDVIAASKRIEGHGHRTPVLTNNTINRLSGKEIFFKCENFQKIGAFKFRGGWNAISSLKKEEAVKGVCTHSSGNHAQRLYRHVVRYRERQFAQRNLETSHRLLSDESLPTLRDRSPMHTRGFGAPNVQHMQYMQ